jgi:DNA-binding IclR family transcriptional regulator
MSGARGPSTTTVVERAFVVLQAVVAADDPVGVREIERRTGVPRSTVSRLLATLDGLGMVERSPDGTARPGTALATLHTSGGPTPLVRDVLRPLLVELVETTGESAALAVDDRDAVMYLAQISSTNPVRAPDVRAERHPFHLVAAGLVIMAQWPADRLDRIVDAGLVAATDHSVTDPRRMRQRVAQARRDGWIWAEEELDIGVNGVATPIELPSGEMGSISLYGPSYRFSPETQPGLGDYLRDTVAARIEVLL